MKQLFCIVLCMLFYTIGNAQSNLGNCSIGIHYALNHSFRALTVGENSGVPKEVGNFLKKYSDSLDKKLYTSSMGFLFNYNLNSSFSLKSGLIYQDYGYTTGRGQNTILVTNIQNVKSSWSNTHVDFLTIPLEFTAKLNIISGLKVGAIAGIGLNAHLWQRNVQVVEDQSGKIYKFPRKTWYSSNPDIDKHYSLQTKVGLALEWDTKKRWLILCESFYQVTDKIQKQERAFINTSFNSVSLGLSLMFKLDKANFIKRDSIMSHSGFYCGLIVSPGQGYRPVYNYIPLNNHLNFQYNAIQGKFYEGILLGKRITKKINCDARLSYGHSFGNSGFYKQKDSSYGEYEHSGNNLELSLTGKFNIHRFSKLVFLYAGPEFTFRYNNIAERYQQLDTKPRNPGNPQKQTIDRTTHFQYNYNFLAVVLGVQWALSEKIDGFVEPFYSNMLFTGMYDGKYGDSKLNYGAHIGLIYHL